MKKELDLLIKTLEKINNSTEVNQFTFQEGYIELYCEDNIDLCVYWNGKVKMNMKSETLLQLLSN